MSALAMSIDQCPQAVPEISDDDLRRAWRTCHLVNLTYEQAMNVPALALAFRRMALNHHRHQQRLAEQLQRDRKRAQANDFSD